MKGFVKLGVMGVLACCLCAGAQGATIHVEPNGSDTDDGLSWADAKKTIQAGVTAAIGGGHGLVLVSNGLYTVSASTTVNAALRVEAFDPDVTQTIVRRTLGSNPIWVLEHAGALVQGFTAENGNIRGGGAKVTDGTLSGCLIRNCTDVLYGPGIWMTGGVVTNCVITNNVLPGTHGAAIGGGGVYMTGGLLVDSLVQGNRIDALRSGAGVYADGGIIDRCRIVGNPGAGSGGGVYMKGGAELRNSVVVDNESLLEAGGVYIYDGTMANCTVSRNQGAGYNGGLYLTANGSAVNCVVVDNSGASVALRNVSSSGVISNSCALPLVAGSGNLAVDPEFVDPDTQDYRLRAGSPVIDRGTNLAWTAGGVDIDGLTREVNGTVDMGAHEALAADAGSFRANFVADARRGTATCKVGFTASVEGANRDGLTYWWDFGNGSASGSGLDVVTNTYAAAGIYTVSLVVSNDQPEGVTVSKDRYVVVGPLDLYVSPEGSSTPPYGDWDSALTNIHWAFANAGSNDVIYVAGRDFELTQTLMFEGSNVTVKGGYEAAGGVGPGTRDPDLWPTRIVREPSLSCLRLLAVEGAADSVFEDLVLEGGLSYYYQSQVVGTGISVLDCTSLQFTRCRVRGNRSLRWGGGVYGVDSTVTFSGGEISLNTVHGNGWDQILYGGGIYLSGGAWTFEDTAIGGNNTDRVRVRSGLDNNREKLYGGGLYSAGGTHEIRNCAIYGNNGSRPYNSTTVPHRRYGGGVYVNGGTVAVRNSTIAGNNSEGVRQAGGTLSLTNCILWDNEDDVVGTVALDHCDIEDGDSGTGCISLDPLFERGLYLSANSPCTNAGSDAAGTFGLAGYTTHTNGALDSGTVDLGYHYSDGLLPAFVELYVALDGGDTQSGTSPAEALRTVTRALARARDGTHIHVGTGAYDSAGGETFPLVLYRPGLHVTGAGADLTTLDADGSDQVVTIKGIPVDGRLEGVTVTGGYYLRNYGAGIGVWQSRVTLDSCRITGNEMRRTGTALGSEYGSGVGVCLATVTMQDCVVVSNQVTVSNWDGATMGGGIGVREGALTIRRSVLAFNEAAGTLRSYNYGGGMFIDGGTHTFENLLVYSNRCNKVASQTIRAYEGDGAYVMNTTNVLFRNCTFACNEGQGLRSIDGGAVNSSIFWTNSVDVVGAGAEVIAYSIGVTGPVSVAWSDIQDGHAGTGNISVDPLFVAANDYHLQSVGGHWTSGGWVKDSAHSLCIDAGDPSYGALDEPQPNKSRLNMGAYGGTDQASLSLLDGTLILLH